MKQQPKFVRHYCCLYHFATGKKDKSSTACYNHVPLGVINPIPATVPRSPRSNTNNLTVKAKKQQINVHTHDLNQIQGKQSLPKRLSYPRVYVEQINPKFGTQTINGLTNYEVFLKKKQFQQIFLMFKKYAKLTLLKSQEQALKNIKKYSKDRSIDDIFTQNNQEIPQYFYTHSQFIDYLINVGFQDVTAQQFWQIAFNKSRFNVSSDKLNLKLGEVISMRAFAYNYKKFYLDQLQTYKNCLSQAALRQRMIDLRLFLEPWFTRNIVFKQNHQTWKQIELQICTQLKRFGEQDLYVKMISLIEMRNKIWLFMRTLAKVFYVCTDQKNMGLETFNQRTTELILKNKNNLQAFAQFMNQFQNQLIANGRSKEQKFKITDLLNFAKRKSADQIDRIVAYLRGLFKYLYFFNKCDLLVLNKQTLNLDCLGIAQISYSQLQQFLSFKRKETNDLMEMIQSICNQVNQTVDARPEISGHKRFVNQCNYLFQTLIKMVKRCDFSVFYRLQMARELYESGDISNLQHLRQIMLGTNADDKELNTQFWKQIFNFITTTNNVLVQIQKDEAFQKNYQSALQSYSQLKKKLEGKLPYAESKKTINGSQNRQNTQITKGADQNKSKLTANVQQTSTQQQAPTTKCSRDKGNYSSCYCPLCDDICSTSVTDSLNKIDEMSSYLMDMLKDI